MEINLTGNATSALLFPVDIVLVMDCSGSMSRYGTIIAGPSNVILETGYQKMGEFSIAEVAEVETMFQVPEDVYYSEDRFSAYLKNKNTGETKSTETAYSDTRWKSVQPGEYEVYAKLIEADGASSRTFAVELPPMKLDSAKEAAKNFLDLMKENDAIALVQFHSSGWSYKQHCTVKQRLTSNKDLVKNNIDSLNTGGGTPMGEGLKVAIDHLEEEGRADSEKAIILLTDGWWNMGCDPLDQADRAAAEGYTVYTIGWGGVNVTSLQLIAEKTGGRAYFPATEEDLVTIYEELAKELSSISAKNVALQIELSDGVTYAGNASRVPDQIIGKTFIWEIGTISVNASEVISFDVKPDAEGTVQVITGNSKVNYENICGEEKETEVPVLSVEVIHKKIPPVALIYASDTSKKNESVKFDASKSYDPDGYIVDYRWNFGDGTPLIAGNNLMITHSYNTSGPKTVTLTVVDNIGATDEETITITVTDEEAGSVSGKVLWNGEYTIHGIDGFVGASQEITATALGITRITDDAVDVTVKLYVDDIFMNSVTQPLTSNDLTSITVTGTWVAMSSGRHLISLRAEADTNEWVGPTNDPTAGVRVFIQKVR